MIDMCGLRVILVIRVTILTFGYTCCNNSLFFVKRRKNFSCILHDVQELANLHYISCVAPMDFLTPDIWATLSWKLLAAFHYKCFFSPKDDRVGCFTRLCVAEVEFPLLWIVNAQDTCKPSEGVYDWNFPPFSHASFLLSELHRFIDFSL